MRFKGTFILLIVCVGFAAFLYFYEYRGGEQRAKAEQEENVVWKVASEDVQQLDLIFPDEHITAVRTGDGLWKITSPRELEADSEEVNRLAGSAADISREGIVEENASDLVPFGLDPAVRTLSLRMKDGNIREIRFGRNNPTGSSTYAALPGKGQVFLVANYVAETFNKKIEDLRNHAILSFDQFETQSLEVQSSKGVVSLAKENDQWWLQGKVRWRAESSSVSSLLGDLANSRIKEFFDEDPAVYAGLGLDKPTADVRLTVGKDKAIKHLAIGMEKSKLVKKGQGKAAPQPEEQATESVELYIARDDSRQELFFVDKDFLDKLLKSPADLRDKTLAVFPRWDIDAITISHPNGIISLTKAESGADWLLGEAKKKAKLDAVNEILDALEKDVTGFVDQPGPLSGYGLDAPLAHVTLKQGGTVVADCIFGKDAKENAYVQVQGEPYVKTVDMEVLEKLVRIEADYLEPETDAAPGAETKK